MKYTIEVTKSSNSHYECFMVNAINNSGKTIFGASAEVRRTKNLYSGGRSNWTKWSPSWGSCNKYTYKKMQPSYDAIHVAMKICEALEAGRNVSDNGMIG